MLSPDLRKEMDMASTAQILRPIRTQITTDERVKEFLDIILPLGFDIEVERDKAIYMKPKDDDEKWVRVWVNQEKHPIYSINDKEYYREVLFDFIWDDEGMNSDMILVIVAEYMKKYSDALFNYEWSNEDNMFLDKCDISNVLSQPFQPGWYYILKSHLTSIKLGKNDYKWKLE